MPKCRAVARSRRQYAQTRFSSAPSSDIRDAEGLRIGYFNSQGLNRANWSRIQTWMEADRFDLLFVAETWYVGYEEYSRWNLTLAVSPRPPDPPQGRHHGGLCLFGSKRAWERLRGVAAASEACITVRIDRWTISGLYFPPSMPPAAMDDVLSDVRGSDIVLGDVNVRFRKATMSGAPPDRARALAAWAQAYGFSRCVPATSGSPYPRARIGTEPTVDHCFIRHRDAGYAFHLLHVDGLRLQTDHRYFLHIALGSFWRLSQRTTDFPRYWIGRLSQPKYQRRLFQKWTDIAPRMEQFLTAAAATPDELNDGLVWLCQRVCEATVGKAPPRAAFARVPSTPENSMKMARDQSAAGTHRLMRQVMGWDRNNGALLSTSPGTDALAEMATVLHSRYTARAPYTFPDLPASALGLLPFTPEQIVEELAKQDGAKACGADGIHIYMLRLLRSTTLAFMLAHLYNTCLRCGTTPYIWNSTEIHVLLKDKAQPKTPQNVRPITLVCIFRKTFESLLLRRFDESSAGWAKVHPTQAGFRRTSSTLTNAAMLHVLLDRRLIRAVAFLDFRSAFDVVDHGRLYEVLVERSCPVQMLALITRLTFTNVRSRVLANGAASDWFPRTCGLLQGSPLSPALFNIFVDSLLCRLNATAGSIPRALFYADDGVLFGDSIADIQLLMDVVCEWSLQQGIALNVGKCGYLDATFSTATIYIGSEPVPRVGCYKYLGFPIKASGIDFEAHLTGRLDAIFRRMQFLDMYARTWSLTHRLRVLRQYLAPMLEYSAPLVWAWRKGRKMSRIWKRATQKWKQCIRWVTGTRRAWYVAQNLLGVLPLERRFELLHANWQWQWSCIAPDAPLLRLLRRSFPSTTFPATLTDSPLFEAWKRTLYTAMPTKRSLASFLHRWHAQQIRTMASSRHLTAIIPFESRLREGFAFADGVLAAPGHIQEMLFRYRCGEWQSRTLHFCSFVSRQFRRGDEDCICFEGTRRLSARDWKQRRRRQRELEMPGRLTRVDCWLNARQFFRAARYLENVKRQLNVVYGV